MRIWVCAVLPHQAFRVAQCLGGREFLGVSLQTERVTWWTAEKRWGFTSGCSSGTTPAVPRRNAGLSHVVNPSAAQLMRGRRREGGPDPPVRPAGTGVGMEPASLSFGRNDLRGKGDLSWFRWCRNVGMPSMFGGKWNGIC